MKLISKNDSRVAHKKWITYKKKRQKCSKLYKHKILKLLLHVFELRLRVPFFIVFCRGRYLKSELRAPIDGTRSGNKCVKAFDGMLLENYVALIWLKNYLFAGHRTIFWYVDNRKLFTFMHMKVQNILKNLCFFLILFNELFF